MNRKERGVQDQSWNKRISHWVFLTSWLQLSNSLIKRQGLRTIFASKLTHSSSYILFFQYATSFYSVRTSVGFCCFLFLLFLVVLLCVCFFVVDDVFIEFYLKCSVVLIKAARCFKYMSSGSASQFPMLLLEGLITRSWLVILALILFCGLSQGLGPVYVFYKNLFFPLGADCHWDADSYVIGSLWSRYQRCIMDHWSGSDRTAAQSVSPLHSHSIHQYCFAIHLGWHRQRTERETQICFQAYIFSFIFCHACVTLPGVTCSCKNSHFSFIETAYKSLNFSNDLLYVTNTCCTQKLISLKHRDQRYSTLFSLIKWSFTSDRPQCFWQIVFESDWRYGYAFLNTLQSKNDITTMLLLWGTSIDCQL